MRKLNEMGSLLLPLIIVSLLLLGALGFGYWAYAGLQDYKNNVDIKITEAVEAAEKIIAAEKESEYAEKEKSPFVTYQGPSTYGSLVITYPKTWSVYIDEGSSAPLSGIMHPRFVPANDETSYALRFEVVNKAYDTELKAFDSKVKNGQIRVSAYRAPKVDSMLGSRLEGELTNKKQGVLILLPLRDKTLKLWTEGQDYRSDFDTLLAVFNFVP